MDLSSVYSARHCHRWRSYQARRLGSHQVSSARICNTRNPSEHRSPRDGSYTLDGSDVGVEATILSVVPQGRWCKPEEIAEVVVFLCSDGASHVTGHVMPVDGGWT